MPDTVVEPVTVSSLKVLSGRVGPGVQPQEPRLRQVESLAGTAQLLEGTET